MQPSSPGVGYFLPMQRYTIAATYELKSCPNANGTAAEQNQPLVVKQTATLAESPIADPSEYYTVPIKTLTSGWKTTSLTVSLYDNGTLKSIGATADDQTGAVVTSLVTTAVAVAKIAIGLPTSKAKPTLCSADVYAALKAVKASQDALIDPKVDDKARTNWAAVLTAAKAVLTISKTYTVDPTRAQPDAVNQPSADEIAPWFATPSMIATSPQAQNYVRTMKTGLSVDGFPASVGAIGQDLEGHGILYREAVPVRVRVCAGDCADTSSVLLVTMRSLAGQFGRYSALPLKNRPFEKNNIALSFTAAGAVDTMTYGTESRFAKMAAALASTATAAGDVADKYRADRTADAAKAATADVDAIKAQTDLINAKADKIEAEQRLAKLGAAKP